MILYVTRQTFQRYKLKMPEEMVSQQAKQLSQTVWDRETGDPFLEWGGKLFYFDGRKCLQVVHFASKLTFVLVDLKLADMDNVGDIIGYFLFDLYADDKAVTARLERYFAESPFLVFGHLTDRRIISTLNRTQLYTLDDGYRLCNYLRNGILHSRELNKDLNRAYLFTDKINGKTDYFYSGERFAELLKERYP